MKRFLILFLYACFFIWSAFSLTSCDTSQASSNTDSATSDSTSWLYVMGAGKGAFDLIESEDAPPEEQRLTLTIEKDDISQEIIRFSERPNRFVENISLEDLLWFWTPEGTFCSDSPNATIQFTVSGKTSFNNVIATITDLKCDDDILTAYITPLDIGITPGFDYTTMPLEVTDIRMFIDGVDDDPLTKVIPNNLALFKTAKWGDADGYGKLAIVIWNLTMAPPENPPVGAKYSVACGTGESWCPFSSSVVQYQPACPAAVKIEDTEFSDGGWYNDNFNNSVLMPGEAVLGVIRSDDTQGDNTRIDFSLNISFKNNESYGQSDNIGFSFNWDPFDSHNACPWNSTMSDDGAYVLCDHSYSFTESSAGAPVAKALHLSTFDRNGGSGGIVWTEAMHTYFSALRMVYGLDPWEKWAATLLSDITSIIAASEEDICGILVIGLFANPDEFCHGCNMIRITDGPDCWPNNPWKPPTPTHETFWQKAYHDFAQFLKECVDWT